MKRAVIVFSGGQDSTTCLLQASDHYDELHCLTFDYGQRHYKEIHIAQEIAMQLGIKRHKVLTTCLLNELSISSLTHHSIPLPVKKIAGIPNTFVPGRNILFLTLAAIYAYQVGAEAVISGVCETDFSGYPDCQDQFIKTLNQAIQQGMACQIRFETPLMWLNKAETWALADYYGKLEWIRHHTLSCYNGIRGDGCKQCAACELRANGLKMYQENRAIVTASLYEKLKL